MSSTVLRSCAHQKHMMQDVENWVLMKLSCISQAQMQIPTTCVGEIGYRYRSLCTHCLNNIRGADTAICILQIGDGCLTSWLVQGHRKYSWVAKLTSCPLRVFGQSSAQPLPGMCWQSLKLLRELRLFSDHLPRTGISEITSASEAGPWVLWQPQLHTGPCVKRHAGRCVAMRLKCLLGTRNVPSLSWIVLTVISKPWYEKWLC